MTQLELFPKPIPSLRVLAAYWRGAPPALLGYTREELEAALEALALRVGAGR